MTNRINKGMNKCSAMLGALLLILASTILMTANVFAQDYQMTIKQRRMGNQIGAEIWVKSLKQNNPKLGNMSIALLYNETFLKPAPIESAYGIYTGNPASTTDSIYYDVNVTMPFVTVTAPYGDNNYGFDNLGAQAAEANNGTTLIKVFTLQAQYQPGGLGYTPDMSGKGSFVGLLKFDIIQPNGTTLSDTDMSQIDFNRAYSFAPQLVVLDVNGNNVSAKVSLAATPTFAIRDITILSPNSTASAIKRNCIPALESIKPNAGYPVFFERSGLLSDIETYGTYGTSTLGYSFALSLDNGSTWAEMGRFAETYLDANTMGGNNNYYASGEISKLSATKAYYVTKADGVALPNAANRTTRGYGGILRFVWQADENYAYRSEEARFKLTQLECNKSGETFTAAPIADREVINGDGKYDVTDTYFVLGRMFFAQLNGVNEYFKTKENFSTPAEITVEAWVNLNRSASVNAMPALVASGSPIAQNIGPWMLYLKNGVYPAFRALERESVTLDRLVADVISPTALPVLSAAGKIDYAHGDNWVHLCATVNDGTVKLYLNGEVVAQETNTSQNIINMYPMQYPIYIGVNPNDDGLTKAENYVNAGIKEVKIWKKALSQAQIRKYLAGVYDPATVTTTKTDDRKYLGLYYPLQANHEDYATKEPEQSGNEELDYYIGTTLSNTNEMINYRPDRAHIKLTSPTGGEGISNLEGENFEVRWAAYGLGSVNPNTADLQIMVSRDAGITWFDAIGKETYPAKMLDRVEIEDGSVLWSPFNNATIQNYENDLQALVSIDDNYAKECLLKISGTEEDGLDDIISVSAPFTIAPHFAFANTGHARVKIASNKDLAFTGSTNMIEAWIRPYDFPTEQQGSYPIFCKKEGAKLHYSLSLMHTGQLKLTILNTVTNKEVIVTSSINTPIVEPYTIAEDATWTHIAAWVNLADGGVSTSVRFYIDGISEIIPLNEKILVDRNNSYPAYISYEPTSNTNDDGRYFKGEIKEVRFWSGNPGGVELYGIEPSDLTLFIQGAQGVRAKELISFAGVDYQQNLVAAWSFDGGSWINGGIQNSIAVYPALENEDLLGVIYGTGFSYQSTKPFIKIVEPTYQQGVSNQDKNLRVRWVGWDYDRNDGLAPFRNGSDAQNLADLDFSTGGGGGSDSQPYQAVACQANNDAYQNAMMMNYLDKSFEFLGSSSRSQYAIDLDMSLTDPDIDDDYIFSDQGPINASQNNGRFRLVGRATMNGSELTYSNGTDGIMYHLLAESELFNITPPSNFTVRVLLEGYHNGTDVLSGGIQATLGKSFASNGLKIQLYENQANLPGNLIASSESYSGYYNSDAKKIKNRNAGENNFANVPFVFTELSNGRYFVTVDHINHLPVTSAYAAPFVYVGDDQTTWDLESGWDFTGWNGVKNNTLTQAEALATIPAMGGKYPARGPSETNPDEGEYTRKQLIYNNGRMGNRTTGQIASMIGGDVYRDGKIDALDRNLVNESVGGIASNADVTGDGLVNSADRIIVYRNSGITTSPGDHPTGAVVYPGSLGPIAAPLQMADFHEVNNATTANMVRAQQEYYENGGTNEERLAKRYKITNRLQGENGISYEVYGEATKVDQYVDVEIFIKNTGDTWALGNSTFGLKYDPSKLQFDTYYGEEQVLFSASAATPNDYGYSKAYSNPIANTVDPMPGLRTIDIVYAQDAPSNISGVEVPSQKTSIGTLRFLINRTADYDFEWHQITNINDVDGLDITNRGDFKFIESISIKKTAEITYPTAGIELATNRAYNIRWSEPTYDDVYVDLLLSTNNGQSWSIINDTPLSIAAQEYYWTTPNINSTKCLMQIREVETQAVIDVMTNSFAILASPVDIIKPCGICGNLLSGTKSEIIWDAERDDEIFFEYSANGLSNWEVVTDVMSCTKLNTTWTVPEVNTANAVIRMKNIDGEVISTSTPFSILTGALAITNPNGVIIDGASNINIAWDADNVDNFDIAFSSDAGATWEVIGQNISANTHTLPWTVPNIDVANAMISAYYPNTPELEYSRTKFLITKSSASGVDDPAMLGYSLSSAVPNPFAESTQLTFSIPQTETITAELYDVAGNKVATILDNQLFGAGNHSFAINANDLTTGTYIVYLNTNRFTLTQRVLVIK